MNLFYTNIYQSFEDFREAYDVIFMISLGYLNSLVSLVFFRVYATISMLLVHNFPRNLYGLPLCGLREK